MDYVIAPPLVNGGPGGSRTDSGAVYVIQGDNLVSGVIDVNNLPPGQPMAVVWGAASDDYLGTELYVADLNNDQVPDLIVGAMGFDPPGRSGAGAVYVLWGGPNLQGTIDLASPPAWVTVIINHHASKQNSDCYERK